VRTGSSLWSQFYRKERYDLLQLAEPDVGQLSKYEIGKLQEVAKTYQDDDEWALVDITHKFPEWHRNDPGKSSEPIPLSNILEAIGQADLEFTTQSARTTASTSLHARD
jgi:hypothetical protein